MPIPAGYNLEMHESLWAVQDSLTAAILDARRAKDDETLQALCIAHKLVARERARFRVLLMERLLDRPEAQA